MRRCPHFSREFLAREPCRRCVHCRGWIDEQGRVLNDVQALRRFPGRAEEIRAHPVSPPAAPGERRRLTIELVVAIIAALWRLSLLLLALPIMALVILFAIEIAKH